MKRAVFAAFEVQEEGKTSCTALQDILRDRTAGSFPRRENLHVTLAYFGYIDEREIRRIQNILKKEPLPETEIVLEHLECFRGKSGDQIVLAGTAEERLIQYRSRIVQHLRAERIHVDGKPFKPHITLVRAKQQGIPIDDIAVQPLTLITRRAVLYHSYQSGKLRIYDPLWSTEEGKTDYDYQSHSV